MSLSLFLFLFPLSFSHLFNRISNLFARTSSRCKEIGVSFLDSVVLHHVYIYTRIHGCKLINSPRTFVRAPARLCIWMRILLEVIKTVRRGRSPYGAPSLVRAKYTDYETREICNLSRSRVLRRRYSRVSPPRLRRRTYERPSRRHRLSCRPELPLETSRRRKFQVQSLHYDYANTTSEWSLEARANLPHRVSLTHTHTHTHVVQALQTSLLCDHECGRARDEMFRSRMKFRDGRAHLLTFSLRSVTDIYSFFIETVYHSSP